MRITFEEIETKAPTAPGVYEIYISSNGEPLKVGIGSNLRKRLIQHRESRQNYLRLRPCGNWSNPHDVMSKRSILSKHLYFDASIENYDLKAESGRREFLANDCHIILRTTGSRAEARELERALEKERRFKYVGRVVVRPKRSNDR